MSYFRGSGSATADRIVCKLLKSSPGSREMNVNGASTAVDFEYEAPAKVHLERSLIAIKDVGSEPSEFGAISELANGLKVGIYRSGSLLLDPLDGVTIKTAGDFGLVAGPDAPLLDSGGAGNDYTIIRWTHSKAGAAIQLLENDIFRVTVQDDLTNLTAFRWMLQGILID